MTRGKIYQIVCYLEKHHTSFCVSRLIMTSGVAVRKYGPDSEDNPTALTKILAALKTLLPPEALGRVRSLLED